jgi:hypothetical protein
MKNIINLLKDKGFSISDLSGEITDSKDVWSLNGKNMLISLDDLKAGQILITSMLGKDKHNIPMGEIEPTAKELAKYLMANSYKKRR